MKTAVIASSLTVAVSLAALPSVNAQNTPTKLTQPIVNAQANAQAVNPEQEQRDARFRSRYGSAPATSRPAPAAAPAAVAPAAVAVPAAPGVQPAVAVPLAVPAQRPEDDARFRSRYGSSMPSRAQSAAAAASATAGRAPTLAPGTVPVVNAVPVVATPVRQEDPEREQRIINFQRQNAISGNPSAQCDLGMRYVKGDGVEQDDQLAAKWLKLAAENNNSRAKKQLEALLARMEKNAPSVEEPAAENAKPAVK
jgi:hypothetical protein